MDLHCSRPHVTLVIPAFNAASTLGDAITSCDRVLEENFDSYELMVVDDGSVDTTWSLIERYAATLPNVFGVRLGRNSGQAAAICAGIEESRGDVIVTFDADMDTRPEGIVALVDAIDSGHPAANGVRRARRTVRRISSAYLNNRLRSFGTNIPDFGSGMIALRRDMACEMLEYGDLRRGYRIKILVDDLAGGMEPVPVPAGRHRPTHYRLADVFSYVLETYLMARGTLFITVATVSATLAGITLLAALGSAANAAVRSHANSWWVAGWLSIISMMFGVVTLMAVGFNLVLRGVLSASTPFYRVVATTTRNASDLDVPGARTASVDSEQHVDDNRNGRVGGREQCGREAEHDQGQRKPPSPRVEAMSEDPGAEHPDVAEQDHS